MKILIATDGSECSEIALKHVLDDRSLPIDCEFRVISVVEGIVTMYPMGGYYDVSLLEAEKALQQDRINDVANIVARLKQQYPRATADGHVYPGHPADQILEAADKWCADLIVLGSHGRRGFSHFLMGSVAEKVAREAKCTVEVIRKPPVTSEKKKASDTLLSRK
ncbi:MAG: universal stress protein [Candidatus Obscuribacterales bacterium]|nr:universal stress protein [Candidatus Obscuribacterales bacterium]